MGKVLGIVFTIVIIIFGIQGAVKYHADNYVENCHQIVEVHSEKNVTILLPDETTKDVIMDEKYFKGATGDDVCETNAALDIIKNNGYEIFCLVCMYILAIPVIIALAIMGVI